VLVAIYLIISKQMHALPIMNLLLSTAKLQLLNFTR